MGVAGRVIGHRSRIVSTSKRFEIEQCPRAGPARTTLHFWHDVPESAIRRAASRSVPHEDRQAAFPQFVNLLENLGDSFGASPKLGSSSTRSKVLTSGARPDAHHLLLPRR